MTQTYRANNYNCSKKKKYISILLYDNRSLNLRYHKTLFSNKLKEHMINGLKNSRRIINKKNRVSIILDKLKFLEVFLPKVILVHNMMVKKIEIIRAKKTTNLDAREKFKQNLQNAISLRKFIKGGTPKFKNKATYISILTDLFEDSKDLFTLVLRELELSYNTVTK